MQNSALLSGLSKIYDELSRARRRQFFVVLGLMIAGTFAELGAIGAVIPFIGLLASGGGQSRWLSSIGWAGSAHHTLTLVTTTFILFAIAAGAIRYQLAMSSRNFVFHVGHELAVSIQERLLAQPYSFHVHRNTSSLLTGFNKTEFVVGSMLLPLMHAVTGAIIATVVVALLVALNPWITLIVAAVLIVTYTIFSALFRKQLEHVSAVQKNSYDEITQVIQESLGGIREVIIDKSQAMYVDKFSRIDRRLADARSITQMIHLAPHYLVEVVGMVLIALVAVALTSRPGGLALALPILGTLALGAQRLLPLFQDIYRGSAAVQGNRSLFDEVIALLSLPNEGSQEEVAPLELEREIRLEDVSFRYPTRDTAALADVNLTIPRGSMVAVTGETGSGKSTLIDVLMALLPATSGGVLIDDQLLDAGAIPRWHRSVAHVPQIIFLADATIGENIALSRPDQPADPAGIVAAAKQAQLHDFVQMLPAGYETFVGEQGVRLSGGQRQRVGIARAIYKEAPVLVLDEATSALDDRTERDVIAALQELRTAGRTIVIVAHRQSTISHCDMIVEINQGKIAACRTQQRS